METLEPAEIVILLRYYCASTPGWPEEMPDGQNALARLLKLKAVVVDTPLYRITAKGRAWAELILETPMPIEVWFDPRDASLDELK